MLAIFHFATIVRSGHSSTTRKETYMPRNGVSAETKPPISRYAKKRLLALQQGHVKPLDRNELVPIPQEELRVRATIVTFTPGMKFLFPETESGEKLFLKTSLVVGSGFDIKPGDTIICTVATAEPGKCRWITWISSVCKQRNR